MAFTINRYKYLAMQFDEEDCQKIALACSYDEDTLEAFNNDCRIYQNGGIIRSGFYDVLTGILDLDEYLEQYKKFILSGYRR